MPILDECFLAVTCASRSARYLLRQVCLSSPAHGLKLKMVIGDLNESRDPYRDNFQ